MDAIKHQGSTQNTISLQRILIECLLNFETSLGKKKCEACRAFYRLFRNAFNKFNNTGARMLDLIYYMTSRLLFVRNVDGSDYIII